MCLPAEVRAGDVWVLRGHAMVPPCSVRVATIWDADAILHNATAATATVTVVDVSNEGTANHDTIFIPAGEARTVGYFAEDHSSQNNVWVTHLAVPQGIVVEGRLEYRLDSCHGPAVLEAQGKVSAPVWRELTPAGVPQLHPGSDLGIQNTRINVGIYNAGNVPATATLAVRRSACPHSAPIESAVTVPPHWLLQTSLFDSLPPCAGDSFVFGVPQWATVTTVTVDQPSLSYAVTLSNTELPNVTYGFASQ